MPGKDVAQTRCNAAIHNCGDIMLTRQPIQQKGVLLKEGNIHHMLPGRDDGLQRLETHEARHRTDDQVRIGNQCGYPLRSAQVSLARSHL